MMNESPLNLAFESELYESMLDFKIEKNNKQFGDEFVEETKKGLKSGEQSDSTNK